MDHVEVPLAGTVPFRVTHDLTVPRLPGVYLFHDLRGVLYVGRTDDLRQRFTQHYWAQANPRLLLALIRPVGDLFFSWCQASARKQIDLERRLIRAFEPPCNRQQYRRRGPRRKP
ncbi:MAG TPA: GIY-YIG nuclease family protein [Thermoleophilaceae bacterium]